MVCRGTADAGGRMWVLCWSLATLQGTAVAAGPTASASCCSLLHPAHPLQHPGEMGQSPVRVGGPRGATSPGHPALHFTWGLLAVGTCRSTSCSGAFGDVGSSPQLRPSLNHPLSEREPWRGQTWECGQGLAATKATPRDARWVCGPSPACEQAAGGEPPCWEGTPHPFEAPAPQGSPPSPLLTHLSAAIWLCALRDAQRGRPSPRVHNSGSHAWTDGRTDRSCPSPQCPPSARRQLLPPARGRRPWVFIHK